MWNRRTTTHWELVKGCNAMNVCIREGQTRGLWNQIYSFTDEQSSQTKHRFFFLHFIFMSIDFDVNVKCVKFLIGIILVLICKSFANRKTQAKLSWCGAKMWIGIESMMLWKMGYSRRKKNYLKTKLKSFPLIIGLLLSKNWIFEWFYLSSSSRYHIPFAGASLFRFASICNCNKVSVEMRNKVSLLASERTSEPFVLMCVCVWAAETIGLSWKFNEFIFRMTINFSSREQLIWPKHKI